MELGNTKEVYFNEWCSKCEYYLLEEYEDPCDECLEHGCNLDSHKPVMFKEAE